MIMNMKRQFLHFIFCLLVLSSHGAEPGVTYYVKPSQSSPDCPGQPSFQYYLDSVNTTLNREKNVTMIFLTGNHTVNPTIGKYHFIITVPIIRMTGNGEEFGVKILCQNGGGLDFYNNSLVVFKNLWIVDWSTMIKEQHGYKNGEFLMSSVVLLNPKFMHVVIMPQAFRMENSVIKNGASQLRFFARHSEEFSLYNCTFYDTVGFVIYSKANMTARVEDCTFINTPLAITQGSIILSGATTFKDTVYSSAVRSYQGNIIVSGVILFLNNFC